MIYDHGSINPFSAWYTDCTYEAGEVYNNTSSPIYTTVVTYTTYNNFDQIVARSSSRTAYDEIRPGEKSPFDFCLDNVNNLWQTRTTIGYRNEPPMGYYDPVVYYHDFEFTNTNGSREDWNYYRVSGNVRNNTPYKWYAVKLIVSLYAGQNQRGTLLTSKKFDHFISEWLPGVSSSFDKLVNPHFMAQSFSVTVEGISEPSLMSVSGPS